MMNEDDFDELFSFGPNTTTDTTTQVTKTKEKNNNKDNNSSNVATIDDELSELLEIKTTKTTDKQSTTINNDGYYNEFGVFQQNDESTRDMLDWVDRGGNNNNAPSPSDEVVGILLGGLDLDDINEGAHDDTKNIFDEEDNSISTISINDNALIPPSQAKSVTDENVFELTPPRPSKKKLINGSFDFDKDILGDGEKENKEIEEALSDASAIEKVSKTSAFIESPINITTNSEGENDYDTLLEALNKCKSLKIISAIFKEKAHCKISSSEERRMLWCKFICNNGNMSIVDLENSNIADAYTAWKQEQHIGSKVSDEILICIKNDINLFSSSCKDEEKDELCKSFQNIVNYYYYQNNTATQYDKHVSSILSVLLKAGYNEKCCITILLQYIYPNYMPLMVLEQTEQKDASNALRTQLYLLCTYHTPLLVLHLDRYMQGWYLQENINHWLLCLFASIQHNDNLLELWDRLLVFLNNDKNDQSIVFFYALAILNQRTESLILLTDKVELQEMLSNVFSLQQLNDIQAIQEDVIFYKDQTPETIIQKLNTMEKDVLTNALMQRTKKIERQSTLKLEIRPKLIQFYKSYNPEKLGKVDDILQLFDGRYDDLDKKLRNKYDGQGLYDIALAGNNAKSTTFAISNKIFSSIRNNNTNNDPKLLDSDLTQICVQIKPQEIFPILLSNHATTKIKSTNNGIRFLLVDCRLEETANSQGRFPTTLSIPPDALNNNNDLNELAETYESIRGAVHIVIMGEGIASLPTIFKGYKVSDVALQEDDISRTSSCALYFIKKGFPFISILQGGFASAYVYLARSPLFLTKLPSLLMDCDPSRSLVAKLEAAYTEVCRNKIALIKRRTAPRLKGTTFSSLRELNYSFHV